MKKIFIFGDSIMKGVTFSTKLNRYTLSKSKNFDELTKNGFEVVNKSKMGATVEHCKKTLQENIDKLSNNIVLFEVGGNDCNHNWAEVSQSPQEEHSPVTTPEEFVLNYSECIELAKNSNATVLISNIAPLDITKFMNWISKGLNYNNILSWLGDTSALYRWQEYYNKLVENLSFKFKCPLLDIRKQFLLSRNYSKLICKDGIHPTDEGHQLVRHSTTKMILNTVS